MAVSLYILIHDTKNYFIGTKLRILQLLIPEANSTPGIKFLLNYETCLSRRTWHGYKINKHEINTQKKLNQMALVFFSIPPFWNWWMQAKYSREMSWQAFFITCLFPIPSYLAASSRSRDLTSLMPGWRKTNTQDGNQVWKS